MVVNGIWMLNGRWYVNGIWWMVNGISVVEEKLLSSELSLLSQPAT